MLELVTIFLATLLISTAAIWIFRTISGMAVFKKTVVGRPKTTMKMKLRAQQGYISLIAPKQEVRSIRLRRSTGTIKAPWGW